MGNARGIAIRANRPTYHEQELALHLEGAVEAERGSDDIDRVRVPVRGYHEENRQNLQHTSSRDNHVMC